MFLFLPGLALKFFFTYNFTLKKFNYLYFRYVIRSSDIYHPNDIIPYNSSIEIKIFSNSSEKSNYKTIGQVTRYIIFGEIDYKLHGLIEEFRIAINPQKLENWILINDVEFICANN